MTTHAFPSNPFARPVNPFLPSEDALVDFETYEVADAHDAHNVSYALVKSGPAVSADEVESSKDAIEVKIRWGTQVLEVRHLEAEGKRRSFTIGEAGDFVIPHFVGTLSIVDRDIVRVPENATATVSKRGEHSRSVSGGDEVVMEDGMAVTIELGDITIEIAAVRAGKKVKLGFFAALASGAMATIGLSALGHAAIVASLAMFMPKMQPDDAEAISRDQILKMQAMLDASAEREADLIKDQTAASEEAAGGGSKGGEPHMGDSGAAGTTKPVTTRGHMAFKGADDHVQLSKKEELALAAHGGFIGILNTGAPLTGHASPWGAETQLGQDPDNKLGAMFGDTVDDAMGYGLGLWGTGEGGGGKGKGIGLDGIGDLVGGGGNGPGKWGIGRGDKDGIGNGHGPGTGGHIPKAPRLRPPTSFESNGRLPAEVIQRIVRQNFGRFRLCYESGLRGNPALTGRVVTKFVIGRDGAVSQASDAGSDLPNSEVTSCIVRSFGNLSFPQPEGGVATVVYPITLAPGE